jgi:hypothetical protein
MLNNLFSENLAFYEICDKIQPDSPVQEISAHQHGFIETERKKKKLVETSF